MSESMNEPLNENEKGKGSFKPEDMPERTQNNIVTSLAEKAMSVASPVMPMKEDGEVDHARFDLLIFSHIQCLFFESTPAFFLLSSEAVSTFGSVK